MTMEKKTHLNLGPYESKFIVLIIPIIYREIFFTFIHEDGDFVI